MLPGKRANTRLCTALAIRSHDSKACVGNTTVGSNPTATALGAERRGSSLPLPRRRRAVERAAPATMPRRARRSRAPDGVRAANGQRQRITLGSIGLGAYANAPAEARGEVWPRPVVFPSRPAVASIQRLHQQVGPRHSCRHPSCGGARSRRRSRRSSQGGRS